MNKPTTVEECGNVSSLQEKYTRLYKDHVRNRRKLDKALDVLINIEVMELLTEEELRMVGFYDN